MLDSRSRWKSSKTQSLPGSKERVSGWTLGCRLRREGWGREGRGRRGRAWSPALRWPVQACSSLRWLGWDGVCTASSAGRPAPGYLFRDWDGGAGGAERQHADVGSSSCWLLGAQPVCVTEASPVGLKAAVEWKGTIHLYSDVPRAL